MNIKATYTWLDGLENFDSRLTVRPVLWRLLRRFLVGPDGPFISGLLQQNLKREFITATYSVSFLSIFRTDFIFKKNVRKIRYSRIKNILFEIQNIEHEKEQCFIFLKHSIEEWRHRFLPSKWGMSHSLWRRHLWRDSSDPGMDQTVLLGKLPDSERVSLFQNHPQPQQVVLSSL